VKLTPYSGVNKERAIMPDKIQLTDQQWLEKLGPEKFHILRQAGTERAFTGDFESNKAAGIYRCGGCGEPLFSSEAKFDSGSGWPSYTAPVGAEVVEELSDASHGMVRTEVRCASCEGHLGHVFPDGPGKNGLRYCIPSNSRAVHPVLGFAHAHRAWFGSLMSDMGVEATDGSQ
jgi:peptide-methionine (R)-S-oxide reductase